ncbi:hypothetical protein ATCVNEJV2_179R [Acanthocystis turfacea Chlorella virus NE-JV-2]|nr:hypothetical protein ATCVNEJV2_179R [Acanthocystis turfacea Chlorella virus NE-JV-2]
MQFIQREVNVSFPTSDPYRVSGNFSTPNNIEPTVTAALRVVKELPEKFNTTFFSRKNVEFIQNKLVGETKRYTGFDIGPQDETVLMEIMIGIYVQDSTYDPTKFAASLAKINKLVITECLKQILPGVRAYALYVRDASRPYGGAGSVAFKRPVLATVKGSRSLPGFVPLVRNA